MKEYKNNEYLIEHLHSKGVIILDKSSTLEKLERYSYYSIINTYKSIFKDSKGNYLNNVSFDEIYALYDFDKSLRNIFLKYSIEIEIIIKSIMANQISKVYGIKDYLNISYLDNSIDKDIKENLLAKINETIQKNYNVHSATTHYLNKYNFIPPFVLTKILTFGTTSNYYGLLKQSDRQAIAKYFKVSDKLLKQILKNLTTIRNIAAHSDRLYDYGSKFFISFKIIDKDYIKLNDLTNLYMVLRCMEKLLTPIQYKNLYNSILLELERLKNNIHSISIDKILDKMGFPHK